MATHCGIFFSLFVSLFFLSLSLWVFGSLTHCFSSLHNLNQNQTASKANETVLGQEPILPFISNDKWNNSPEPSTIINHYNSDLPTELIIIVGKTIRNGHWMAKILWLMQRQQAMHWLFWSNLQIFTSLFKLIDNNARSHTDCIWIIECSRCSK